MEGSATCQRCPQVEQGSLQLSSGSRVLVRSRLQGAEKLEGREPMGKLAVQTEKGLSVREPDRGLGGK